MAELKHNFMKGRMNKDLDERLVPQGEYRHAVNVEVATSESSNMGSLQTLLGNTDLSSSVIDPRNNQAFFCVGSIADEKNDKLYWLLAGTTIDVIAEYDYKEKRISPVVVDIFASGTIAHNESGRALNFDKAFLVTGINIIDDILFWTDNNTEPKRINIPRCKMGSVNFTTQTQFYTRDNLNSINEIQYRISGPIQHEHLTVIKKPPPTAPALEMINTNRQDLDLDSRRGELTGTISASTNIFIDPGTGLLYENPITIQFDGTNFPDYKDGDILTVSIFLSDEKTHKIRVQIQDGSIIQPGWNGSCSIQILSGDMSVADAAYEFYVELEQDKALFRFKFPRFGYRYKYEDGEYSTFSPFTEVAFLPDRFDYLPKEAYNLGMVNRLRHLVIKDFVDHRQIPDDVISVDILYKESNSPNIYSVKTIKRTLPSPTSEYEEWNADSEDTILPNLSSIKTSGFVKITTEMIHAILPSNQLLRPWDNVPRKALGQEVVGNRLVYGNYLQNYNLFNTTPLTSIALDSTLAAEADINIDIKTSLRTVDIGTEVPEQYNPKKAYSYVPAKSIKSLRHYQVGVIYVDEFGRETPVFSDSNSDSNSIYVDKATANKQNKLKAQILNTYPEWAKSFKFYIKETSGEYYNLAMDRWYDAEDGNIWLSFPSAERNKLDVDTYLILKKAHDGEAFVPDPARYKVIAIENEAPQFVKTFERAQPTFVDTGTTGPGLISDSAGNGWPLQGQNYIWVDQATFENLKWNIRIETIEHGPLSDYRIRFKSTNGISNAYQIKSVELNDTLNMAGGTTGGYKITFIKNFGSDVNITTLDGTYATAVTNLVILLNKIEIENKPEFQGRFFAKIKNDSFIKNYIAGGAFSLNSEWTVSQSLKSQYINPVVPNDPADGMNHSIEFDGANWYGCDPGYGPSSSGVQTVSIDERCGANPRIAAFAPVDGSSTPGTGREYWHHIAGSSNRTASNGWFIDKIEGFRPFFNSDYSFNANWGSYMTLPHCRAHSIGNWGGSSGQEFSYVAFGGGTLNQHNQRSNAFAEMVGDNAPSESYYTLGWKGLQVQGTGENGYHLPQGPYLGCHQHPNAPMVHPMFQDAYPTPSQQAGTDGNVMLFGGTSWSNGLGGMLAAIGIGSRGNGTTKTYNLSGGIGLQPQNNIITLSRAGFGDEVGPPTSSTPTLSTVNMSLNDPSIPGWAQDYVDDVLFIQSITTPGVLWRWAEDPGGVVYKTKTPVFPISDMVEAQWNLQQHDYVFGSSGEKGVALFNTANFTDYPVHSHNHEHGTNTHAHITWASMDNYRWGGSSATGFGICDATNTGAVTHANGGDHYPLVQHGLSGSDPNTTAGGWGIVPPSGPSYMTFPHQHWPTQTREWMFHWNKRRRYTFFAEALEINSATGQPYGIGQVGPHYYSPTNNCDEPAHFDASGNVLSSVPTTPAPGIRNDGMYSGYAYPQGSYTWNGQTYTTIPHIKKDDGSGNSTPAPGSVTWQILTPYFTYDEENPASTNPAIWETEPKETTDLDIYYEVGQAYPIKLDNRNNEQFLGPIHLNLKENSVVTCFSPPATPGDPWTVTPISTFLGPPVSFNRIPGDADIRVSGAANNMVLLSDVNGALLEHSPVLGTARAPEIGDKIVFTRADGSKTETTVIGYNMGRANGYMLDPEVHNYEVTLPWHNCYSFGNGVESDRVRDDFNQVTIDNGAKASTVLEEPYLEERRSNSLIYSGIYNSVAGINNLNQFIQAEKITKDLNPTYGSIQKLHQRNFTLTAFCEDRVLKILANKDALYNADGNPQLISTNRVLGEAQPYAGEYGISKNPESFAVENFRAYFADKSRGAILRLSKDGLTPISDAGMHDWFSDKLPLSNRVYGSFDDRKKEYNISLNHTDFPITLPPKSNMQAYAWVLANCKTAPCSAVSGPSQWEPTNKITVDAGTNIQVGDLVKGVGVTDGVRIESIQNVTYNGITMLELELCIVLSNGLCDTVNPAISILDAAALGGASAVTSITSGAGCTDCLGYWNTRLVFYSPSETVSTYKPPADGTDTTVSFSEINRGWVSFKSWIAENGISLNNSYYTIKNGNLWEHHTNPERNTFHTDPFAESSVTVMLNEQPGSVKSFQTLNYEGSQSRITENITDSGEYWDNYAKNGWYVSAINSDLQEGDIQEFKEKEGKWFSQIKGQYTEWTDDGTAGNLDGREFSFQGIGQINTVTTPCAPNCGYTSWDCQQNTPVYSREIYGNEYVHEPGVTMSWINYWFINGGALGSYTPTVAQNQFYTDYGTTQTGIGWIEMGPVDTTFSPDPHYVNGVDNTNGHYRSLGSGDFANDTSTTITDSVSSAGVIASSHPDHTLWHNEYGCATCVTPGANFDDPTSLGNLYVQGMINASTYPTFIYNNHPMYLIGRINAIHGNFGGQITQANLAAGNLVWETEGSLTAGKIGVKDILSANGIDINLMVHHNQVGVYPGYSCTEIQGLSGAYPDEPTCVADIHSPCGLTGTSWECQPVMQACVNPTTGNNVIVQTGFSPDGHNRHGAFQTDCNGAKIIPGDYVAHFQEHLRWFFDAPSRQSLRFEDYVSQQCNTDAGGSGCVDCIFYGWNYIQGDGINTAPFYANPYIMPPKFYTVEEIINYYSTWYPVYLGMDYIEFLDAVDLLWTSPNANGVIGEQRFLFNYSIDTFTCSCPYTNCSNPQNAVTSTGFQCIELLGSTTGPHPDEATCIANSPSCAPPAPCAGTPHDITVFTTDATDPSNTGTCNRDGDAYVSVILLNGASTWTVEWYDAAGTLIAPPPPPFTPQTYSGNTTSQSFVTSQASIPAFPPGLIDGDYYVEVTDNFGCPTITSFTIDCIAPQPCPVDPHVITVTSTQATNLPICDNGSISVTVDIGAGPGGNPFGSTNWSIRWFAYDPTSYNTGVLSPNSASTWTPTYTDPTVYTSGQTATWLPPDSTLDWGYEICDFGGTQQCCNGLFGPVSPGCTSTPVTPYYACCETNKPGYDAGMGGCIDLTNPGSPSLVAVHDCFNDNTAGTGFNGPYYTDPAMCDAQCPVPVIFSYGCCTDPFGCTDYVSSSGPITVAQGQCYGELNTSLPYLGSSWGNDPATTKAACDSACTVPDASWFCCEDGDSYTDPSTGLQTSGCLDWSTGSWQHVFAGYGICYDPGDGSGAFQNEPPCLQQCPPTYGCTDPNANNYDPLVTIDDGSCAYDPTYNCSGSTGIYDNQGTFQPPYTCWDPMDGTGTYSGISALFDCVNGSPIGTNPCAPPPPGGSTAVWVECGPNPPYCTWNSGLTTQIPVGAYTYNSTNTNFPMTDCLGTTTSAQNAQLGQCPNIPPPDSWDCDQLTGVCSDPGTGLGQFTTLAACNAGCGPCPGNLCADPFFDDVSGVGSNPYALVIVDNYPSTGYVSWNGNTQNAPEVIWSNPPGGVGTGPIQGQWRAFVVDGNYQSNGPHFLNPAVTTNAAAEIVLHGPPQVSSGGFSNNYQQEIVVGIWQDIDSSQLVDGTDYTITIIIGNDNAFNTSTSFGSVLQVGFGDFGIGPATARGLGSGTFGVGTAPVVLNMTPSLYTPGSVWTHTFTYSDSPTPRQDALCVMVQFNPGAIGGGAFTEEKLSITSVCLQESSVPLVPGSGGANIAGPNIITTSSMY